MPRRFGKYLLFDRIGRGGMADIYLARVKSELGAARRVVVKEILKELSGDPHFARMLIDEAKLVAGLRHANVAQVLDLGREDGRLFIAMEYVEGFDLHQLLVLSSKRKVPFPAEFAIFVVREVLAALGFAHRATDDAGVSRAIVHRDVSPSNVLISFEGEVKLCDFGIAKAFAKVDEGATAEDASEDARPRLAGKAAYMSPEHARGDEIDARADVFAAGIVLYELCAGRRLYRGTESEMLALARAAEIPPLPDRGLPRHDELAAILARALAVDPKERFQSAAEMQRALDDYAVSARLFASQLRFGAFLSERFEDAVVVHRRARERAAEALEMGPPLQMVALSEPPSAPEPEAASEPAAAASPAEALSEDARRLADENTRPLPAVALSVPAKRRGPALATAAVVVALVVVALLWLVAR